MFLLPVSDDDDAAVRIATSIELGSHYKHNKRSIIFIVKYITIIITTKIIFIFIKLYINSPIPTYARKKTSRDKNVIVFMVKTLSKDA